VDPHRFSFGKHSHGQPVLYRLATFSGVVFQLGKLVDFLDVTSTSVQDLGPSNVTSVPEPGVCAICTGSRADRTAELPKALVGELKWDWPKLLCVLMWKLALKGL